MSVGRVEGGYSPSSGAQKIVLWELGLSSRLFQAVLAGAYLVCCAVAPAQFYILRKLIEAEWGRKGFSHKRTYVASLSSQTIVYKGQLMPSQV